jgi:hypothetical protein
LIFTVAVAAAELLGVTEEGETEQDASVGAPLQDNVTGSLYPATELTVAVTLAVFPATTEVLPGETATPKSEPPPVSVTNCGLLGAESLMVRVPVFDPKTVGMKVTLIVQMALGATGAVHVLVCTPKPALADIIPKVRGAVPVLVTVTTCGALVEPTTWGPKVRLVGASDTDA